MVANTDAPAGHTQIDNLASDADLKVIPHFTTTGLRDTAAAGIVAEGMACTVGNPAVFWFYRGAAWHTVSDDDTGPAWITPGLATGFGSQATYATPQYTIRGGIIEWCGVTRYITASTIPIDTLFASGSQYIPAGSPSNPSPVILPVIGCFTGANDPITPADMGTCNVVVRNDGGIRFYPRTTASPQINLVFLDGLRWRVS